MQLLRKLACIAIISIFATSNYTFPANKSHNWTLKKTAYFGTKVALLAAAGYVAYISSSAIWERLKLADFEAHRRQIYKESYDHPWIALGATGLILYAGYYLVNSCLDDVKSPSER